MPAARATRVHLSSSLRINAAELLRRAAERLGAVGGEALLHFVAAQRARSASALQPRDDRRRRACGREQAVPLHRRIARHPGLGHRRHAGQRVDALRPGYRERAHAGPSRSCGRAVSAVANIAAIWPPATSPAAGAVPCMAHAEPGRFRPCSSAAPWKGAARCRCPRCRSSCAPAAPSRGRGIRRSDCAGSAGCTISTSRRGGGERDRREVAHRVIRHLLVQHRIQRQRARAPSAGCSRRARRAPPPRCRSCCRRRACSRPRTAGRSAWRIAGQHARHDVGAAAGQRGHDDAHGARRIVGLRDRRTRRRSTPGER